MRGFESGGPTRTRTVDQRIMSLEKGLASTGKSPCIKGFREYRPTLMRHIPTGCGRFVDTVEAGLLRSFTIPFTE
ncbi:hypothetical protein APA73_34700 [Pseudomonas aeruginosa]|nr:hypothetical protein APA58_33725 [Pseudomonas aeruginosa]OPE17456.1 hypothetical protein APA73_34700 [Pseudomonas aeruginosa]